jgi:hypothetical protein
MSNLSTEDVAVNHAEATELAGYKQANSNLARCYLEMRAALYAMVTAHNGYRQGMGPCICAAHEDARRVLGINRDDTVPKGVRS